MKKTCPGCRQSLELISFAFKNKATGTRQPYCDECRRARAKDSYQRNKRSVVKAVMRRQKVVRSKYYELKKTLSCKVCNEHESCCLTFHHTDPKQKDLAVSNMVQYSWNRIQKEIKKCVCLCANCHAKVHAGLISL